MLRLFGNMQLVNLAGTPDQIEGLKVEANSRGGDFLIEEGNYLYARAIFMGYDLPNGNGDAIGSIYAGTFGPSFIGKHLDINHQLDPASMIGKIMATWHIQKPFSAGDGPLIIGRNMFGRDIEGRPRVFGFAPPVDADPMELQLEGIFRVDRNTHAGKITAEKLLAKEMDSVSQEASTEYCVCSVCAHKIAMPYDRACEHLVHGSLMLRSHKVPGYNEEVLAYKSHHNPVGTGLGVVTVPAYDKAKLNELTAQLKAGHLTVETFRKLVAEQELVWGRTSFVVQASRDLPLLAADAEKPVQTKKWDNSVPALTPGTPGTPAAPGTPGTPLASSLRQDLNALVPMEADGKAQLFHKLVSVAAAQARINREALSLTRHVAMAAVSEEMAADAALDGLAQRVCRVAEVQATLDLTRRALLAGIDYRQKAGAPEGMLLASAASSSIGAVATALRTGSTRAQMSAAKNRIDGFMPLVAELQTALYAEGKGLDKAAEVGAKFVAASDAYASFTEHFDRWRDAKFPGENDREQGVLAQKVMASFVAFKAAYEVFEGAQMALISPDHNVVANSIDKEFGLTGLSAAPKRLRMRAGTMDLVAAYQSTATEERSRAVVAAFSASTAEWLPGVEASAINSDLKFKNSMQASDVVNGLGMVVQAMGRRTFVGGLKSKAMSKLVVARQAMTTLVRAERVAATNRVLAKAWLKAFSINPSFDVEKSAPAILAQSGIKGLQIDAVKAIGTEVQHLGGPWPWTEAKPQSFGQFVASKTNEELADSIEMWAKRVVTATDEAKAVIDQNVNRLDAVLKDRVAAKGVVAKFFRQPVLAESHWTLFDADGNTVGRFTLAAAAKGKLDRHVEIGGKKVFLASWLQSDQYGRDIVTHAKLHGLTATLKQFDVKAGGGAGIIFDKFEFADGGKGVVQADGSVKWSVLPKLSKFNARGYMDGLDGVRGDLLDVVDVTVTGLDMSEGGFSAGDEVFVRSGGSLSSVWQGGWIRSEPKAGETINIEKGGLELYNDTKGFEAEAGTMTLSVTEDFVYFYQDVFNYPDFSDEDVREYANANSIELEDKLDWERARERMIEDHYEDAQMNWTASQQLKASRRFRAADGHYKSDEDISKEFEGAKVTETKVWPPKPSGAKGESFQWVMLELEFPDAAEHVGGGREGEGPHYVTEQATARLDGNGKVISVSVDNWYPEKVRDWVVEEVKKAVATGPNVDEQGHRPQARRRVAADFRTDQREVKDLEDDKLEDRAIRRSEAGRPAPKKGRDTDKVYHPKKERGMLPPAGLKADQLQRDAEAARKLRGMKAGKVYEPSTGAEHGAFVAFCSALADALDTPEFEDIASNFPMSGSELTYTLPAEMAAANVDIKEFVDALVPAAQEAIDSVDKQLAGKTTVQELADEFGDKVWSDIVLQAMGHGVALTDDPNVADKLKELGLGKVRPTVHLDNLGYDEAWQACNAYIQATTEG